MRSTEHGNHQNTRGEKRRAKKEARRKEQRETKRQRNQENLTRELENLVPAIARTVHGTRLLIFDPSNGKRKKGPKKPIISLVIEGLYEIEYFTITVLEGTTPPILLTVPTGEIDFLTKKFNDSGLTVVDLRPSDKKKKRT